MSEAEVLGLLACSNVSTDDRTGKQHSASLAMSICVSRQHQKAALRPRRVLRRASDSMCLFFFTLLCFVLAGKAAASVDCDAHPTSLVPQGVHTAFAGPVETSLAISWFTCAGGSGLVPVVSLSPKDGPGGDPRNVTGTSSKSYSRFHHDVVVSGLAPATRFSYSVGFDGPVTSGML